MDALELLHRLSEHQRHVNELLSEERLLVCVGSRLLAISMVQSHLNLARANHESESWRRSSGAGLIGCVTDVDEALKLVYRHRPTLVICTERIEGGTGVELVGKIKSFKPDIKVLLFLEHSNGVLFSHALAVHPDGIMLEPSLGRGYLLLALSTICAGGMYLEPEIASVLHGSSSHLDPGLTERELEVMQQVVHGLSDRQIAAHLMIALPTVKHHLQQVYQKLAVRNRTRAAIALLLLGIVQPPSPLLPNDAAALRVA